MRHFVIFILISMSYGGAHATPIHYRVNGTVALESGFDAYQIDGAAFEYVVTADTEQPYDEWVSSISRTGYVLPVEIRFTSRPSGFSDITIFDDRQVYIQTDNGVDEFRFDSKGYFSGFGDGNFLFGGLHLYFSQGYLTEENPSPLPGPFTQSDITSAFFIPTTGNNVNNYNLTITDIPGGVSAVPIPPGFWLFGSGLLGLIGVARHKA